MKIKWEQRRQAMLQLRSNDQQCIAYKGATYIRGFTVGFSDALYTLNC